MNRKKNLFIFSSSLFILFLIILFIVVNKKLLSSNSKVEPKINISHSSQMNDLDFYAQSFGRGKKYLKVEKEKVYGGIVPHHLLADPLISAFFEGIKDQEIKRVVLISPNHSMMGENNIVSSKAKFTTVFGELSPDLENIKFLEQAKTVHISEENFEKEHGILVLTPFIKAVFPNSILIPITIKGGAGKQELDILATELNKITNENTIVIVSSDFSHDLTSSEAEIYDNESISAIENFDLEKVIHLHHTRNTDSPESIYVLLKIMQLKNVAKAKLLVSTNSSKIDLNAGFKVTTSYVTMYFTK